MISLDLKYLRSWIGEETLEELCKKRKKAGEIKRRRKLGTVEMLLICLGVAINSERNSLHDIIRHITTDLGINWSVSVAGFCKARARFSPQKLFLRLS